MELFEADDREGTEDEPSSVDGQPTYSVAELIGGVADAIAQRFPSEVWVTGEIHNLNRSARGHVYFSLVDPGDRPKDSATLKVSLFDWYRQKVNLILTRAHGQIRMADGVKVRVRGTVNVYAARGELQLRMTSIDPEFTLGSMAAQRAAVLARLAAAGLTVRNRSLPLSPIPLRVGLVTSASSAAAADFIDELSASGFPFEVLLADTQVQGIEAPAAIVASLDRLAATEIPIDVVAVVRGGGARTDLAAFDDEAVATAIATHPVPVICGIGHEIDRSIADEVAYLAEKTPTAAAQSIIARVAKSAYDVEQAAQTIAHGTRRALVAASHALDSRAAAISSRASRQLDRATVRLDRSTDALRRVPRRLEQFDTQLDAYAGLLQAADPQRLASRGWAIVRRLADGGLVRSSVDAPTGTTLQIRLTDSLLTATVDGTSAVANTAPTTTNTTTTTTTTEEP